MALRFTGTAGQNVNLGSAAALDNLDEFTYIIGVTPSAANQNCGLLTKGTGGGVSRRSLEFRTSVTTGAIFVTVDRATTNADAESTANAYSAGDRLFIVMAFDLTSGPNLYLATDNGDLQEVSYAVGPNTGSGATGDNSANNQFVGAYGAGTSGAVNGDVWFYAIYNRRLTLAEAQAQRRHLWGPIGSGCVAFKEDPGLVDGTGTQNDRVGSSNGTLSGSGITAVDHPGLNGWMPTTPYAFATAASGTVNQHAATGAGQATAAVDLAAVRGVAASAAGQASTSASLAVVRALEAQAAGLGTVTVDLSATAVYEITAAALGQGTASVEMAAVRSEAATAAGQSSVSVDMAVVRALEAQADGVATVTAAISDASVVQHTATATGQATVTAALARQAHRDVQAAGQAAVSVDMAVVRALGAQSAGQAATSLDLATVRALAASASGLGSVALTLDTSAATTAVTGKYAAEHALAYRLVKDAEERGYSLEHARAFLDVFKGGV